MAGGCRVIRLLIEGCHQGAHGNDNASSSLRKWGLDTKAAVLQNRVVQVCPDHTGMFVVHKDETMH